MTDVMTSLPTDAVGSGSYICHAGQEPMTRSASVLWSVMRWPADLCGLIRDICGRGFSFLQQLAGTSSSLQAHTIAVAQQRSFQAHCRPTRLFGF